MFALGEEAPATPPPDFVTVTFCELLRGPDGDDALDGGVLDTMLVSTAIVGGAPGAAEFMY